MKKTLLLVCLLTAGLLAQAQTNLTNGLVAYYPFDGDARDYSGNNYHLTVSNAVLSADSFNHAIGAYSFNGTNASLSSANALNFGTNSFTVSAWYQTTQSGTNYFLTGGSTFRAWTSAAGASAGITMVPGSTNSASGGSVTSGAWTHYLATFDGSTMKIYLNGSLKNSAAYTLSNLGSFTIQLGMLGASYFNGKLDEMALYNRVVNSNEITALASRQNIPGKSLINGLVAYYPFNGNANDYSGNGYNLTVTNATLTSDMNSNAGSAYTFNGSTAKMTSGNNFTLNSKRVSVSAWIKSNQSGTNYYLYGGSYAMYMTGGNAAGMSISNPSTNSVTSALNPSVWNHVVGVYDSTSIKIYINGLLKNVVTHPGASFGNFALSLAFFNNSYWAGDMDEVVIYNRALNTDEVGLLYQRQNIVTAPVPNFYASKTTICVGDTLNFFDSTQNLTNSWLWTFNGAVTTSSTAKNPTGIKYNTPGTYDVKLKVSNSLYSDSLSKTTYITVVAPPNTPTISTSRNPLMCTGDSVILTCDSTGSSYQWYKNGNLNATTKTHTTKTSGDYKVEISNASGCKATSALVSVVVSALPNTPSISSVQSTTICMGDSVLLTCDSTATQYQWYLNGNTISNGTSKTFEANTAGSYTVEVSNAAACKKLSAAKTVTVNPLPSTPSITAGAAAAICPGDSVLFTSSSANGNQWYKNGNSIAGGVNDTYYVTDSGDYTLRVYQNGCASAPSAMKHISVYPKPATSAITGNTSANFNTTQNYSVINTSGSVYLWNILNGTQTSGTNTNAIQVLWGSQPNGTIKVLETSVNGCKGDTVTLNITLTQGPNGIRTVDATQLSIYPNPTKGTVILSAAETINSISIYSLSGNLLLQQHNLAPQKEITLPSNLANGIYLLKAETASGSVHARLIVNK